MYPSQCRHCEKAFGERDRACGKQGEPQRHQVTELPKIEAHITEYQCHKLQCVKCGKTTQAALPEEVKGNFGPELTALIACQTVTCRMPRRVVMESVEHVLGIPLSLGSVQNVWEEVSAAVAEPYDELARQLPQEPVLNSDETVDHWRRPMHNLSWISRPCVFAPGLNQRRKTLAVGSGGFQLCVLQGSDDARSRGAGCAAGRNLRGDSVQRPLRWLYGVSQGRGAVLLGAL